MNEEIETTISLLVRQGNNQCSDDDTKKLDEEHK